MNSTLNSTPPSGGISRRSVALGAAWAVPAVALATAAPAFAASAVYTTASVCRIFEGTGNANTQRLDVHLNIATSDGTPIQAGTTFTYRVTLTGTSTGTIPGTPALSYGSWMTMSITNNVVSGTTRTFDLAINVLTEWPTDSCSAYMTWDNNQTSPNVMRPNSIVDVVGTGATSPTGQAETGGVSFNVGSRAGTINNTANARPLNFLGVTGAQNCYPAVRFSRVTTNSNWNAQVCYQGASCTYATPAAGAGQMDVAQNCPGTS